MPLQTRKPKKDGRKRTYSLVSNNTTAQAGPVATPKTVENSSPSQQANRSRQALNAPAVPENPPQKPAEPSKMPNVFEFLEENEESSSDSSLSSSSSSESESDEEPEPPRPVQTTTKIQAPKPRANTVPHGVLVSGGNTPRKVTQSPAVVSKSPKEPRKPAPPPAPSTDNQLVTRKRQPTRKPSPISTEVNSPSKGQLELSRPQTYHGPSRDSGAVHRPPLPPSPPRSPEDSIHRTTPTKRRDSNASQELSGYGLLASHLTKSASEDSGGFPPLYRRFETMNHRVLLHLQDEISQMEEDLHTLDEYEEMHRVSTAEHEGAKPLPASRRRDAQSQAYSSLHYRRMDLMNALIHKTEQYNNALSAYSKVLQTLPRASEQEITGYRSWMRGNKPIAGVETRFLIHDADLVSLTPRLAASAAAAPVYIAIIIASGALLLPLLAFSLIAEFSGRLVVVTVVGGAAAAIAANYSAGIDTLVDSRDGWRCATIYFGFMTMAAMFIP
ncbi:unnamed protein product [Penicillium nalgiovense]|uniref:DUF6594 domain-containing protein n=1 Tax=Penicillium nalgiovense TaxID=60175 RepID=A0A9W4INP4_PENNA|nr:unnamed protein product [Penicillium nalgiovense]CAG8051358.1 unnamed protein product [Penicillium nalgiovense]CAG8057517.1 unnamed protein product [Penicillium nalgiovense]CAG8057880.1 unnamed protein product [Penicillium nalgiovense]CAG8061026.1 unnamed protein product [Penicillium nalgiovense]